MVSINFRADEATRDEIRGAVLKVQKVDPSFSRDQLLRLGAELVLERLRSEHNDGKPFRKVSKPLTAGKRPDA